MFGAFSIAVDEPFKQGDFVKIDTVMGTIESIGLRSTRIRTLDRTIVAIPNGKLAEMRTETFAARDRLRLGCTVSLVYQTTAEQMRSVLAEIESALRAHPKIVADGVSVCFEKMTPSSLGHRRRRLLRQTFTDWNEFQVIRQAMLLAVQADRGERRHRVRVPHAHRAAAADARPAAAPAVLGVFQ